jgi:hypothetical protein
MLWSGGVASEVIRPMAAPVLGGILIADEVIDLLLPVLFYHVRRRRLRRLVEPEALTTRSVPGAARSHAPRDGTYARKRDMSRLGSSEDSS